MEDKRGYMTEDRKKTAIDYAEDMDVYGQKWNERGAYWTNITFNVNKVNSHLTEVSVKTVGDFVRKEIVRVHKQQEEQTKKSGTLDRIDAYTQKSSGHKANEKTDRLARADVEAERRQKKAEVIEQVNWMHAKTRGDEISCNNLVRRTRDWVEEEGSSTNRRARQTLRSVSRDIESAEKLVRKEHTFFQEALERMEGYTNQIVQSSHRTESLLKAIQQNTTVSNQIEDAIFRFMAESQNAHTMDQK
ncbi:hypothetical protein A0J61_11040 [Choanephora cucurbitarum]|uniref:Uncharacterized protein n=1 Tax=Choanephora cucurbitarum TaxID=101091 RepID=A0A1C7MVM7_9FUNG|nr:hypothetical protein A0J61_11040 [Choanephora cucurbitarum]